MPPARPPRTAGWPRSGRTPTPTSPTSPRSALELASSGKCQRRWLRARVALALAALVAGASGGCAGEDCAPGWRAVFPQAELTRPALAVWGRGDELWLVGGPAGGDGLTLVRRWDGQRWLDLPQPGTETLWWVWGDAEGRTVWMVGERGLVRRWNGRELETLPTGLDATLFGVWGSGADDVWLVGGNPGRPDRPNDVVLHWDGTSFTRGDAPPPKGLPFFKVWGAAANDMWVVGAGGTVWRRTPAGWTDHSADLDTRLMVTTVHGCAADDVYTVAGDAVYRFGGARWARIPEAQPHAEARGVYCAPRGVLVVGNSGLRLRWERDVDRWFDDTLLPPEDSDFHAAWIAPDGAAWAVGGNYNQPPTSGRRGLVVSDGCAGSR